MTIGVTLQRDDGQRCEDRLELLAEAERRLLGRTVPKLAGDDDARADSLLADARDAARDCAVRVADDLRHDVRIQEIAIRGCRHDQRSTDSMASSSIGGNCSDGNLVSLSPGYEH